jgi:hypothetical protein
MGIHDIPVTYEAFEQLNIDHEKKWFRYHPDNALIAKSTRNLMLSWVLPKWLWGVGIPFIHALIDRELLDATGLSPVPEWFARMVRTTIWLRGRFIRLLPPRRHPRLLTRIKNRTYPNGYKISLLGAQ